MLGVAAGGLDKKRVALQDMFQARLAKTAKSIIKDVQHERKVINSIQKDIGFDIIKESIVPERAPVEFCYSLPVGKALAGALFSGTKLDIKQMKLQKQQANKDKLLRIVDVLNKEQEAKVSSDFRE